VRVKLTKKFAEMLNGVDLSRAQSGDVLDIPPRDAGLLLASEWALPVEEDGIPARSNVLQMPSSQNRAEAADRPRRRRAKTA
jgi:hypothetical protein